MKSPLALPRTNSVKSAAATGTSAPSPTPWITRAIRIWSTLCAIAAPSEQKPKIKSAMMNDHLRPIFSPK